MLKQLSIKNYALIRQLSLEPSDRLNVITGETGAGKSILLGAMGLLMGNRTDSKVLLDEEQKCVIEGIFDISQYKLRKLFKEEDLDYDDQTVIRRELSPGGKSRAFINDTPVTVDVMKRIGSLLMDIHSQHETLLLGQQTFQLKLVDAFAASQALLDIYTTHWSAYLLARKNFDELSAQADTLRQEADYVSFQLEELEKMGFEANEQDALESEVRIMDHAGDIKSRFRQVLDQVSESEYASRNGLAEARAHLQQVASIVPAYQSLSDRLESVIIELDDLMGEVEREGERVDFDPERAEVVRERLNQLYRLLKKHKAGSIAELLALQEELSRKSDLTAHLDEALAAAEQAVADTLQAATDAAAKLSATRKKILPSLSKQISALLENLGMPNATLRVDAHEIPLSAQGTDRVEIMFSANKGIAARPLSQVASGGEFSRLMFSIKYVMAEKTAMPTLVLDEIDSGISGEVAIKLGNMMKAISKRHQIIAISHLPQIAAKADAHYFVYKDHSAAKTTSSIRRLSDDERVSEIAKMIGGEKPSKVALENARELVKS